MSKQKYFVSSQEKVRRKNVLKWSIIVLVIVAVLIGLLSYFIPKVNNSISDMNSKWDHPQIP